MNNRHGNSKDGRIMFFRGKKGEKDDENKRQGTIKF